MSKYFSIWMLVGLFLHSQSVSSFDLCLDTNNSTGVCIPIDQCKYYYKIIQNQLAQYYELIAQTKCSLPADQFHICCPLNRIEKLSQFVVPLAQGITEEDVIFGLIELRRTAPPVTEPPNTEPDSDDSDSFSQNPFKNNRPSKTTRSIATTKVNSWDTTNWPGPRRSDKIIFPTTPKQEQQTKDPNQNELEQSKNTELDRRWREIISASGIIRPESLTTSISTSTTTSTTATSTAPAAQCGMIRHSDSPLRQHPWAALILYTNANSPDLGLQSRCGGSLISDRFVIASAQCVDPSLSDGWRVVSARLGEWDLSQNPDCMMTNSGRYCADNVLDMPVTHTIIHPDYNADDLLNDVALLFLAKRITFSDFIFPICILPKNSVVSEEQAMLTVGWCMDRHQGNNFLKQVNPVKSLPRANCQAFLQLYEFDMDQQHMCVEPNSPNVCLGSSLILKVSVAANDIYYLAGLMNVDNRGSVLKEPALFTQISGFSDWIQNYIRADFL